jgi:membrane fusion protein, copper/silver efflux system
VKSRQRFAITTVLFALLSGCHGKEVSAPDPVTKIGPNRLQISADAVGNLKLGKAEMQDFPDVLNVMGKISPTEDRTTNVPARASGRIDSVLVASGESVGEGQILATLFSPDFVSAKEEYLQSLKQAQSGGEGASDFTGLSKLARKKLLTMGLSEGDIDGLATSGLEKLPVRSPRAGAIVTKNATVGSLANTGDILFSISSLNRVWFLGDLYPEDLPKVKRNQEILIEDPINPTKPIAGRVSFISPVVDPTVRTIKLRALMDNPSLSLRADMYVQGSLILSNKQSLLVPSSAVLHQQDSDYIFKVVLGLNQEKTAGGLQVEKTKVTLGPERKGLTAVLSGLQAGDGVISDGALLLEAALNSAGQ